MYMKVVKKIMKTINIDSVVIKEKKVKGMAIIDKNSLIDYLADNYQIDRKNIIIE